MCFLLSRLCPVPPLFQISRLHQRSSQSTMSPIQRSAPLSYSSTSFFLGNPSSAVPCIRSNFFAFHLNSFIWLNTCALDQLDRNKTKKQDQAVPGLWLGISPFKGLSRFGSSSVPHYFLWSMRECVGRNWRCWFTLTVWRRVSTGNVTHPFSPELLARPAELPPAFCVCIQWMNNVFYQRVVWSKDPIAVL